MEIEKSLSRDAVSGKGDTGTSSRSFATLLTWLSEHKTPVFVIGTSNDHTKLPTEFMRKGRFDELYWIDLPTEEERKEILTVLIKRHGRENAKLDIKKLAAAAADFTGAELEQAIISAMFDRFSLDGKEITTINLMDEINATKPLALVQADDVAKMRQRAEGKLKPASAAGVIKPWEGSKDKADRKIELSLEN